MTDLVTITAAELDDLRALVSTLRAELSTQRAAAVQARRIRDVVDTERVRLLAAVERVRAVHRLDRQASRDVCGTCIERDESQEPWPCATIAALNNDH